MAKENPKPNPKDIEKIEEHIANAPKEAQSHLKEMRKLLLDIVPNGIEGLSYAMPTIRHKGKAVVCYAAWKNHLGFYPMGMNVEKHEEELKKFNLTKSKGAIQLPYDKPFPTSLIKNIVKDRLVQISEKLGY